MTSEPRAKSRPLVRAVQIAATLGLLALLWRVADGPETARTLATADAAWLLACLVALTLQTVLSAMRWRLTAAQLGIALTRSRALREYYLAQIVNQALPGGVLGDAARAVRSRRYAGLAASGQAVIFERLAGQIGMFLALSCGFLATLAAPGGFEWPAWLVPPVMLLVLVGAALPVAVFSASRIPGRIGRDVMKLRRSFGKALASGRVLPLQVTFSLGTTLCNLAAFAFCARAIGVFLPPAIVFALVPLILFAMLIPLTISGWGVREGAAAALFPLTGATASEGFAASVTFGLMLLVAALPGVIVLWLRSQKVTGASGDDR